MNAERVNRFIVSYDIADDARRTRVAKTLESYGDRIQYSVFIVDVKPAKLVRLHSAVQRLMDNVVDSLMICDLGPVAGEAPGRMTIVGRRRPLTGDGPLIF